ncbi:MAG: hypothetical protein JWR69_2670 [Pedosphaera sp.]|nr:hypothetical protein [Pedosphaera sp.]
MRLTLIILLAALAASAQTNPPPAAPDAAARDAQQAEQIRTECINGRRFICGKVVQITKEGLVVESGYTSLTRPPLNQSWVVPGTVSVTSDPHGVEGNSPGTPCFGLVFLTDIPKRPAVKPYDFVVIQAYPAGQYVYTPVPTVQKTIRRFAAGLPTAVALNLKAGEK